MAGYRFTSTTALLLVVLAAVGLDRAIDADAFGGRALVVGALLAVTAVGNVALSGRIATSGLPGAVTVDNVELRSDQMAAFDRTDLRILDSAGLADMQIAHGWGDLTGRWQYAFEERRPLLVHTHGAWSRASALASLASHAPPPPRPMLDERPQCRQVLDQRAQLAGG